MINEFWPNEAIMTLLTLMATVSGYLPVKKRTNIWLESILGKCELE